MVSVSALFIDDAILCWDFLVQTLNVQTYLQRQHFFPRNNVLWSTYTSRYIRPACYIAFYDAYWKLEGHVLLGVDVPNCLTLQGQFLVSVCSFFSEEFWSALPPYLSDIALVQFICKSQGREKIKRQTTRFQPLFCGLKHVCSYLSTVWHVHSSQYFFWVYSARYFFLVCVLGLQVRDSFVESTMRKPHLSFVCQLMACNLFILDVCELWVCCDLL